MSRLRDFARSLRPGRGDPCAPPYERLPPGTIRDPEALEDEPRFIWEPGDLDDPRTTDTDDD